MLNIGGTNPISPGDELTSEWLNAIRRAAMTSYSRLVGLASEDGMDAGIQLETSIWAGFEARVAEDVPVYGLVGFGGDIDVEQERDLGEAGKTIETYSPTQLFTADKAGISYDATYSTIGTVFPIPLNRPVRLKVKSGETIKPGHWCGPDPNGYEVVSDRTGLFCLTNTETDAYGEPDTALFMRAVEPHSIVGEVYQDIPGFTAGDPAVIGQGFIYVCYKDHNGNLIRAKDPSTKSAPWIVNVNNLGTTVIYDPEAVTDPAKKIFLALDNILGIGLTITSKASVPCEVLAAVRITNNGDDCSVEYGTKTIRVSECPTAIDWTKHKLDYTHEDVLTGVETYNNQLPDQDCNGNPIPGRLFGQFINQDVAQCNCLSQYLVLENIGGGKWVGTLIACDPGGVGTATVEIECSLSNPVGFTLTIIDSLGTRVYTLSNDQSDPSGSIAVTISSELCDGLAPLPLNASINIGTVPQDGHPFQDECGLKLNRKSVPRLNSCGNSGATSEVNIPFTTTTNVTDIQLKEDGLYGTVCTIAVVCNLDCAETKLVEGTGCETAQAEQDTGPGNECTDCSNTITCDPGQTLIWRRENGILECGCADQGNIPAGWNDCGILGVAARGIVKTVNGIRKFFRG